MQALYQLSYTPSNLERGRIIVMHPYLVKQVYNFLERYLQSLQYRLAVIPIAAKRMDVTHQHSTWRQRRLGIFK